MLRSHKYPRLTKEVNTVSMITYNLTHIRRMIKKDLFYR